MVQAPDRRRKHGRYGSRLYRIWAEMKAGCRRPSHRSYRLVGAKGISYAPAWETFAEFARWAAASGYQPDLTLARKRRDQDFTPDNCCWRPFQPRRPQTHAIKAGTKTAKAQGSEDGAGSNPPDPSHPHEEAAWPIEKGIPLQSNPAGERRARPKRRWPFRRMEPLDSFMIPTARPELEIRLAYAAARRLGIRIATRRDTGGVRVWKLPPDRKE